MVTTVKHKVLIIARQFIPYYANISGIIRILKLAEYLDSQGYEVYILASKGFRLTYLGYEEVLRRFRITYVPDLLQYATSRIQLSMMQKKAPGRSKQISGHPVGAQLSDYAIKLIKEISVPDPGIFFVYKYVREALKIINEHGIRNVIISSPPHSMQVVGWRLKEKLREDLNLIVDYRDTWNTTKIFQKKLLLTRLLNEFLERKVLSSADHLVYCTRPMLQKLNEKFFDITHKSLFVMNGFDTSNAIDFHAAPVPHHEYLTIGHFGSINDKEDGFRNPSLFFDVIEKMEMKIKIKLYGNAFISKHWLEKLKDKIELCGSLPYAEAQKKMQEMDILMLIHSEKEGAEEVVTGKFFEYMLAQRPILAIGPAGMEALRLVRDHGLGYSIDLYDHKDIARTMERVYSDWGNGALPHYNQENLMQFSRQNQYSKLLNILE